MKRLLIIFVLLSQTLFGQENKEVTIEEKLIGLQTIYQEMNYNFAYFGEDRTEWDSLYKVSITKVLKTKSLLEYYSILSDLVNYFHEGHTTVSRPDSLSRYYGSLDISVFYYDDNFYVKALGDDFVGKIKLGAKIVDIDGQSSMHYFNNSIFTKSCTAPQSAKSYLTEKPFRFFRGMVQDSVRITLINPKGDTVKIVSNRKRETDNLKYVQSLPSLFSDTVFSYVIKKNIAYVKIGSFLSDKASSEFKKIVSKLKKCKGIVFDLRGAIGGNSDFALAIVEHFTRDSLLDVWWGQSKINNSSYRAYAMYPNMKTHNDYYADYGKLSHFEGGKVSFKNLSEGELSHLPIVVLCNGSTASSSEMFIVLLKQLKKISVIGEPSYGSITMPLILSLPYGGSLYIGVQRALDEKGMLYQFIEPDILYTPTWEDRMKGKDVARKMALESF